MGSQLSQASIQAEREQLAAAALRAQQGLESRENRRAEARGPAPRWTLESEEQREAVASSGSSSSSSEDSHMTTVIVRNIPVEYTRQMFLDMLDNAGFAGRYDFVYMPRDFQRSFGLGYVFVNFVSAEDAWQAFEHFQGFRAWEIPSQKICEVGWSSRHQGLQDQIKRYRNSPLMHESVPDEYKPVLFQKGVRIEFPSPTIPLKPP